MNALPKIQHFLAEDSRTARRFLSSLKVFDAIENLHFERLDKDTPEDTLGSLLQPIMDGHHVGVLSESGCPGVADPGALAVQYAHRHQIKVVPLVGPSSLLLALMASGLNGQQFAFHGYLPIDAGQAARSIRELEKESSIRRQTQIFIETPYRNRTILKHLIANLKPSTLLCIAIDITGAEEMIITKPVKAWSSSLPELAKKPCVFLFLA